LNILFHTNQIAERGTEVAIYDYAEGNETILGGKSFIAAPADRVLDDSVLERFRTRFTVFLYTNRSELDRFAHDNDVNLFYQIVDGDRKELALSGIPSFSHCVFSTRHAFGDYYCPISDFLNRHYHTHYPVLPHIIKKFPGKEESLRAELGIPPDAVVFGGYGGKQQFDIPFVKKAVMDVAREHNDKYFLFMNFEPFADGLANVIFIPKHTDIDFKERFINTCDAMLHARSDGETFGISIAEFSVKNRPVFTWKPDLVHTPFVIVNESLRRLRGRKHTYATAHIDFLGISAFYYHGYKDLRRKLLSFNPSNRNEQKYDRYSERFSPERVMRQFDAILNNTNKD